MSPDELGRRQVPGHGAPAEGVADDEVGGVVGDVGEVDPAVAGDDPQIVVEDETELVLGDVDDAGVELEHEAGRARAGRGEVAGDREAAAAEVHGLDRLARRGPRRRRRRRGVWV